MKSFATDLSFETFEEATAIQKQLCRIQRENNKVTFGDLLRLRSPNVDYPEIYEKHGWYNIVGMTVELNYDTMKYVLKMPQIILLDKGE